MEGQHIDTLNVSQTRRKFRHAIHFLHVVGPTRHDYEANPDWMFSRSQPPCEFMNRLAVHAGKALVQIRFYSFQAKHHEIDRRKIFVTKSRAKKSICFEGCVNPTLVNSRK